MNRKRLFMLLITSLTGAVGPYQHLQANVKYAAEQASYFSMASDQYAKALNDFNQCLWPRAARKFKWIASHYQETSFGFDSYFFLGISYYMMSEFDLANDAFSLYLADALNAEYFQEALEYKLKIAEKFKDGAKGHLFGVEILPKWSSCQEDGLKIYDELITACPNNEMTAQALYGKAKLLWQKKDYRSAVDTYQILINRFPKSEYTPDSYLMITKVFLEQSQKEFQNPDLLVLADMNIKRFEEKFPSEDRLTEARDDLLQLKEIYAKGLRDTAYFYERIDQPRAAVIYYQKVILGFPETKAAEESKCRLSNFCPKAFKELEQVMEVS